VSFTEAIKTCLSKYVAFKGRARRSEYWWFYLFYVVIYLAGLAIDIAVGNGVPIFAYIAMASLLLPMIAVTVRRLHDTGRSAWMLLIALIPVIGGIWLFVLTVLDSEHGENEYGPSPVAHPGWGALRSESARDSRHETQSTRTCESCSRTFGSAALLEAHRAEARGECVPIW